MLGLDPFTSHAPHEVLLTRSRPTVDSSLLTIDYEEWKMCLALCGTIKYEEVEEMSTFQRVEGIIINYIRGEDESKWGSEHDVPRRGSNAL